MQLAPRHQGLGRLEIDAEGSEHQRALARRDRHLEGNAVDVRILPTRPTNALKAEHERVSFD
jgi:hypothetical protein